MIDLSNIRYRVVVMDEEGISTTSKTLSRVLGGKKMKRRSLLALHLQ